MRERRARDIAAESLEPATVSRWDPDVDVEAHAVVLRDAGQRFGVGVSVLGLDAIAQAPPSLAGVGARRDAGAQRCGGERGQEGLVSGEGVVDPSRATVLTGTWQGYAGLPRRTFRHRSETQGRPERAAELLSWAHTIFSNLKTWLHRSTMA